MQTIQKMQQSSGEQKGDNSEQPAAKSVQDWNATLKVLHKSRKQKWEKENDGCRPVWRNNAQLNALDVTVQEKVMEKGTPLAKAILDEVKENGRWGLFQTPEDTVIAVDLTPDNYLSTLWNTSTMHNRGHWSAVRMMWTA